MRIFQVDAFTDQPFAGNPAAVCLLDAPMGPTWMQAVGAEMNLAETAFVEPADDGFGLRWFTPTTEVDLCGHATLASAHVLWEGGETRPVLRFHTRSGVVTAERTPAGIRLDFPADPAAGIDIPAGLIEALGARPVWVGATRLGYLAQLDAAATVRALAPDFAAVRRLPVNGVTVTAAGDPGGTPDFVSRFFAPALGIDEDPVTGAAHCGLGPHWAARLGRDRLVGYQASPRGGWVGVQVAGDRVLLTGQAVTVLRGDLLFATPGAGGPAERISSACGGADILAG